jgi:hypothetical protein
MTQKEIKQLAEKIYEEYIFGGIGRPKYGVDFDKRHIIQALEMMVHKTREWHAKNLQKAHVTGSSLTDIRQPVLKAGAAIETKIITEHTKATMLENIEQNLIELMADYLDSESLQLDQAIALVKDPIPREESELHIRMAKAAFLEYKKTIVNANVSRVERGWGGHFICSHRCLFRRNTLLTYGDINIVVSTVGLMLTDTDKTGSNRFSTIGYNRHYETMAFHAADDKYKDADVSRQISFKSDCAIAELYAELRANEMHERVVAEITERLLKGEKFEPTEG